MTRYFLYKVIEIACKDCSEYSEGCYSCDESSKYEIIKKFNKLDNALKILYKLPENKPPIHYEVH